ncbi:hypothetical protein DNC80_10280 [Flavobacterium sp. SOK18b]|uniref:hypothetical protein n=1 Tax=Flavobacterium sp. SOK18b TaxID=797900 RepID=UPI0015F9FFCD|nr:hypothetical protein [Flavobacterium sp. SOK18b]MBB1194049.1 hypothetical protein [Flavobacterium sp. SOK18b]
MNYTWNKITDRGQYENGFVEVYEASINSKKAVVIITYLPQFEDKKDQNIVLTVLLDGEKESWTEGIIKNILFDVEESIKEMENFKFRHFNSLNFMMTQIFYTEKLSELKYLNSGDYSFLN